MGSLMRHFLREADPVASLPGGVLQAAAAGVLVAMAGIALGGAAGGVRASARAIAVATIAVTTRKKT